MFADTKRELEDTSKELEETSKKLEETTGNLHVTTDKLHKMTEDRDVQKHLVGVHVNTENKLHSQATQVCLTVCTRISCVKYSNVLVGIAQK